jgi:hypothetical protein
VWRDNWLPRDHDPTPVEKKTSRLPRVDQLFIPGTKEWDVQVLEKFMWPHDVAEVRKIKVPANMDDDFLARQFDNRGLFTVKSAYLLAIRHRVEPPSAASGSKNVMTNPTKWDLIWKASVPQKVKIFGWRLAHEALGTEQNRCKRTMAVMPTCSICGRETEDGFHAVVACTKARALRHEVREVWDLPPESSFVRTCDDWLQIMLSAVDDLTRSRLLLLFWRCWYLRNDIVHAKGDVSVSQSVGFLQNYCDLLFKIRQEDRKKTKNQGRKGGPRASAWKVTPEGWAKLNTDASFNLKSGVATAGCIIRNCRGEVLLSAWFNLPKCAAAEGAEFLACLHGVKQALQWCDMPLVLEVDCLTLAEGLRDSSRDRSRFGPILLEIKQLSRSFRNVVFCNTNRESNRVAHELAQLAKRGVVAAVLMSCL